MMQNPILWTFWCWCLLKASHKYHKQMVGFQNIEIEPGQFVFGRKKAAEELPLSERQIRTCIKHLEKTENLTIKTTNKFSIITIVNWNSYQCKEASNDQQSDQQTTSKRPASDHKQECKELKEVKTNELPKFIDEKLWQDFREHRKKLRKPMTDRAEKIIFGKLETAMSKNHDPNKMIETAIERGWQSVFEPDNKPASSKMANYL